MDAKTSLGGHVIAVLNLGSSNCDASSADKVQRIFQAAGLSQAEILAVEPAKLEEALDDAAARADVIVVLGGDGSICSAAIKCGVAGKFLIPLPGGTMNMLPRGLYGELNWEEALTDTLADPISHDVSGGVAEGHLFFCAAILGPPGLWADVREALRTGDLVSAIKCAGTAIRRSHDKALSFKFGGDESGVAEAVIVVCPLISRGLAENERSLEAAAVKAHTTATDFFRIAFHAIFDDWRRDPAIHCTKVSSVRVTGRSQIPVILDGEKVRLGRTINIEFASKAFRAIIPAGKVVGSISSL